MPGLCLRFTADDLLFYLSFVLVKWDLTHPTYHPKLLPVCDDTFQSIYKSATTIGDEATYPPSVSLKTGKYKQGCNSISYGGNFPNSGL